MTDPIVPVTVDGRYFWRGTERFLLRGVVYQRNLDSASHGAPIDPIADDQLVQLERDVPLFVELGLNAIFVYRVDNTKSHDAAMRLLAEAGIYVLASLSYTPYMIINRFDPLKSYNTDLLYHFFDSIDCLAAYPNTLGVLVSNGVINNNQSTVAAEVIRASVRDIKKYMKLKEKLTGQRRLPVGISAAPVMMILRPSFQYFAAGSPDEAIDFFSFSNYSWAGRSSMQVSGYNNYIKQYSDTPLPIFFSEYGGNTTRPRLFDETSAIYSPPMTSVFSGGFVYEFFEKANRYGLVKLSKVDYTEDSEERLLKQQDFTNYKRHLEETRDVEANTEEEWKTMEMVRGKGLKFPETTGNWRATPTIPVSPLDWGVVMERVEEREWVEVDRLADDVATVDLEERHDNGDGMHE